ncbi:MAG TPA: hypothetical protein PKC73_12170 [Dermatophilaceae bacterium]|jgi:type VI protein secretion system component VasK|nr:hypothetical protein [Actinomycetales bacterium]HMT33634.1 hypothetical protein [Dermatophilaceae bacterium]HMT90378.1 hypothetical protein [Dermatophilaceae bacterium]
MVAVGLVLLLIGVGGGALFAWLALQSSERVGLGADGLLQLTVQPITVFIAGAVAMLLLWMGVRLMAAGAKRKAAQRRELRELKQSTPARTAEPQRPAARPNEPTDRSL